MTRPSNATDAEADIRYAGTTAVKLSERTSHLQVHGSCHDRYRRPNGPASSVSARASAPPMGSIAIRVSTVQREFQNGI
jgi:hypothetical protein